MSPSNLDDFVMLRDWDMGLGRVLCGSRLSLDFGWQSSRIEEEKEELEIDYMIKDTWINLQSSLRGDSNKVTLL